MVVREDAEAGMGMLAEDPGCIIMVELAVFGTSCLSSPEPEPSDESEPVSNMGLNIFLAVGAAAFTFFFFAAAVAPGLGDRLTVAVAVMTLDATTRILSEGLRVDGPSVLAA